ncbi:MAG: hypothetical protein Tsb0017_09400 [Geothermobacteraceae bacterium]|nr:MAG: hypothetical protein D6751_09725 [Deltaproteobacteria bacterium]
MYFVPLNQIESVELVVHALRAAGGEADCSSCPARKVCMKQCLAVAEGIERLLAEGALPMLGEEAPLKEDEPTPANDPGPGHLKRIK